MTWTKLDESFDHHPKVVAAGLLGELMHIHGLIYANRYLTDGFLDEFVVGRLLDRDQLEGLSGDKPKDIAELLVVVGIWDRVEGGYQIHDFLEYQPSRADVLAKKALKQAAGQAGGQASARARAQANSQAGAQAKSKPVSVSVSVPVTEGKTLSVGSPKPAETYGMPKTHMHVEGFHTPSQVLGSLRIQPEPRKEAIS